MNDSTRSNNEISKKKKDPKTQIQKTEMTKSQKQLITRREKRAAEMSPQLLRADPTKVGDDDNPWEPLEGFDGSLLCAELFEATGIRDQDTAVHLIGKDGVASVSCKKDKKKKYEGFNRAVSMMKELSPKDPWEGMLIARMVVLHEQLMSLLNSVNSTTDYDTQDKVYISISRLSKMWNESKDRLDRHRRKSDQRIEVKHQHIHVNADKAIVAPRMEMGG